MALIVLYTICRCVFFCYLQGRIHAGLVNREKGRGATGAEGDRVWGGVSPSPTGLGKMF